MASSARSCCTDASMPTSARDPTRRPSRMLEFIPIHASSPTTELPPRIDPAATLAPLPTSAPWPTPAAGSTLAWSSIRVGVIAPASMSVSAPISTCEPMTDAGEMRNPRLVAVLVAHEAEALVADDRVRAPRCDSSPMETRGSIRAPDLSTEPRPTDTSGPTVQNGSISTPSAIVTLPSTTASGETLASGEISRASTHARLATKRLYEPQHLGDRSPRIGRLQNAARAQLADRLRAGPDDHDAAVEPEQSFASGDRNLPVREAEASILRRVERRHAVDDEVALPRHADGLANLVLVQGGAQHGQTPSSRRRS